MNKISELTDLNFAKLQIGNIMWSCQGIYYKAIYIHAGQVYLFYYMSCLYDANHVMVHFIGLLVA